tara:strand:+ start:573 stop:1673 length:1101 start_codon:yes stop_codon:yes gene_type:complete
MMSGFWKWTIAALGLVGLGIAALALYEAWLDADPIRRAPAELQRAIREKGMYPPAPTPEQLRQVAAYPDVEQDYWLDHLMRGKPLPDVGDITEYCARQTCPEFPTGYHSYQTEQGWFYIPLVWSRLPQFYYSGNAIGWTSPQFLARPGLDFEHRNADGRIDKRISFKGDSRFLSLTPFFAAYEPGLEESGEIALGRIEEVEARRTCGYPFNVRRYFDCMTGSMRREAGFPETLPDYDENFWFVAQGLSPYRVRVEYELISKAPVFRGRRVLMRCSGGCRVLPLPKDDTNSKAFLLAGGVQGTSFFLDYKRPGEFKVDPDWYAQQLDANDGYSFQPGGSDLLVEYIKAADRVIDRMQTPDPAFMDYE